MLSGDLGGRTTVWQTSWDLIQHRPWFDFDNLSLSWLRPVIGYGPDLFRYTYLLASPPQEQAIAGQPLLPEEPDHAHNFFIHQSVEQGVLGLLSALGIFAAVFVVGGYQLLHERRRFSTVHTIILIGLLAVVAGRFVEMMVGVARVADLTILWVVLGAFAALTGAMHEGSQESALAGAQVGPEPAAPPSRLSRRGRSRSRRRARNILDWNLIGRGSTVTLLILGIFIFTWLYSVNSVRAAVKVGDASKLFDPQDWQGALALLDQAIELAPDVSVYHNFRAQVYFAYLRSESSPQERGCAQKNNRLYRVCLATQSYNSNQEGSRRRPFYWRSRMALANSAHNLGLADLAAQHYRETADLVPTSWPLMNELANAQLDAGQPASAWRLWRNPWPSPGALPFPLRHFLSRRRPTVIWAS